MSGCVSYSNTVGAADGDGFDLDIYSTTARSSTASPTVTRAPGSCCSGAAVPGPVTPPGTTSAGVTGPATGNGGYAEYIILFRTIGSAEHLREHGRVVRFTGFYQGALFVDENATISAVTVRNNIFYSPR